MFLRCLFPCILVVCLGGCNAQNDIFGNLVNILPGLPGVGEMTKNIPDAGQFLNAIGQLFQGVDINSMFGNLVSSLGSGGIFGNLGNLASTNGLSSSANPAVNPNDNDDKYKGTYATGKNSGLLFRRRKRASA